jgi:ubiquinone/menaquinone biosynthesis C-methylase UbiE
MPRSKYSILIDPLLRGLRSCLVNSSGIKKGDKVLDVCCGTGEQVFSYGKKETIAVGIDIRKEIIEVAKAQKEKKGLKNVSFVVGDAQKLPFENDSFDFASICLGLHEMGQESRDNVISEMKRVVKKSGYLILVDFKSPLPKTVFSFFLRGIERLAGKENFRYFKNYLANGGLPELLKKNNLEIEKENELIQGLILIIKAKIIL